MAKKTCLSEIGLKICSECQVRQFESSGLALNCSYLSSNLVCPRIQDIDLLIRRLFKVKK